MRPSTSFGTTFPTRGKERVGGVEDAECDAPPQKGEGGSVGHRMNRLRSVFAASCSTSRRT